MAETATAPTPVNQLPREQSPGIQLIDNNKENPNVWAQLGSATRQEVAGTPAIGVEAKPNNQERVAENTEKLEASGEVGQFLAGVYQAALEENPQLATAVIRTGSKTEDATLGKTGGYARHKDMNPDSEYSITVNTNDGFEHYEELLKTRSTAAEIATRKMGIDPNAMDVKTFAGFIFAHELGHIGDYMKNAPTRQLKDERRKRDLATLPVPGLDPSQLASYLEREDGQAYFASNMEALASKGINTAAELINVQETSYRKVETEDIPDQFAAKVMAKIRADKAAAIANNPELADQHIEGLRAKIDKLHESIEPVQVPEE